MIDHKVLATIPGQKIQLDEGVLEVLREFTYNVFAQFPETCVHVGHLLPRQTALDYIREFRGT